MLRIFCLKFLTLFFILFSVSPILQAYHYGTAGCGLGALVFRDAPGKIQILAATVNNIISPQTSAITSGTSNCYEDSKESAALFITINKVALLKDITRGGGETLDTLSKIYQCNKTDILTSKLQHNFEKIYPHHDTSSVEISKKIESIILKDKNLAQSCKIFS